MNRLGATTWPIAIGLALAGPAFAQSSVALYGIVDQSVRYTTHASAANDSAVQMANGAITNSRWGMKGAEDLGDGLKAIFRLENGFEPQSGQADGARLFGRYAYVGLSGRLGTVELGRQTTEGFNLFGDLDPLTIGNYTANMWPYFLTQGYANNVVSYANTLGGLAVGASYGLGGVAGAMSRNAYWGVRSAYTHGALTVGAVYQQTRDADGRAQQMWGAAGRYAVGPATLFVGYLGGKDATGAIDRDYLNAPGRTVAYGSFADHPRYDAIGYAGVAYRVDPALMLTGAFYYDAIRNVNGVGGNGGKRRAGVLEAEYALSKATQLYASADYNQVCGGAATEMPGRGNQTGVALGLRHMF
ncbi:porin [Burkholderia pseudomallei]|uniref:porin n=1 Tax=Burkholderia pseudomallei TaxID=28450 RepID=UPI00050D90CE|nr:porin [Burkholderia pseudomallei]KGX79650.1 gram-negative porin family protein [Burkholderia pseudomallei MSHR435]AJX19035.1 gram-negative porin family protein [Burkholderia pseudomallei MSHR491]KGD37344.1 gram-negative porin family protein [Burkholderia pseudomallei]KGV27677.1 gram-negative porin family protein [Burkholderia pseudomallei MSHR4462]KGW87533.1 gram-negative porin family protein [Burkholderia pseudomallei MSHR449]